MSDRELPGHAELSFVRPDGWAHPSGYADGIIAEGRLVFIAGQVGWNPRTQKFETADFVEQVRQALRNVLEVLRTAGGEPRHVVRMTWFITDRAEYVASRRRIGEVYREEVGLHFPAMSLLVVSALLEEGALVEIEATAVV